MRIRTSVLLTALTLLATGTIAASAADNDAMIKNAMSAAPEAIGENATILTFDDKMNMVVLKKGTNNFTCMSDDPTTPSTDHSREVVPLLVWGPKVRPVALGVRRSFADVGQTVAEFLGAAKLPAGDSFLHEVWRD